MTAATLDDMKYVVDPEAVSFDKMEYACIAH